MSSVAEHSRKSPALQHSAANSHIADHRPEIDHPDHDHKHGFEWLDLARVLFVGLAAAAVWFHLWEPFHRFSVIGLAAALIGLILAFWSNQNAKIKRAEQGSCHGW